MNQYDVAVAGLLAHESPGKCQAAFASTTARYREVVLTSNVEGIGVRRPVVALVVAVCRSGWAKGNRYHRSTASSRRVPKRRQAGALQIKAQSTTK